MRLISNLKRATYAAAALALVLAAMPILPVSQAWADGECFSYEGGTASTMSGAETALADTGGTIMMTCSPSSEAQVIVSKNTTLDLAGNTYTGSGEYTFKVQNGATLTITDSSSGKNGKIVANGAGVFVANGSKLILEEGAVEATGRGVKNEGETIVNGGSITTTSNYEVTVYNNGALTLNDGALVAMNHGSDRAVITVDDDSTFTMNGGTINTNAYGAVAWLRATITMNGGEINASTGVSGNGTDGSGNNTQIDLVAGTINANVGVYHPQIGGVLNIGDDMVINAEQVGVEIRAGELNITGGTIKVNENTAYNVSPNGNGSTTTGAAVAVAQHTTKRPITVNISGSTLTGPVALSEANPQNNSATDIEKVTIGVSGGTFVSNSDSNTAVQAVDTDRLTISGGTFSDPTVLPAELDNGKVIYKDGNDYVVGTAPVTTAVPSRVLVKVGVETEVDGLNDGTNGIIQNYGQFSGDNGTTLVKPNTLKATKAGLSHAKVEFEVYNSDGTRNTAYDKLINVHAYTANNTGAIYMAKDAVNDSVTLEFSVNGNTYDTLEVRSSDTSKATIVDNGNGTYTLTAVAGGTAEIQGKVTINSADHETTGWMTLGTVYVYDFNLDAQSPYDVKRDDSITFEATEANTNATVTAEVQKNGVVSTDLTVTPPTTANGGEYTVEVGENALGEYKIVLTDTLNGQSVGNGGEVTIRVHKVKIDENKLSDGAIYIIKDDRMSETVISMKDEGGFGTMTCSSSDNDKLGARKRNRDGACALRPQEAGTYTVTFTDGVDARTVNAYVIDFTLSETSLHVKKSDGVVGQIVSAVNKYWYGQNEQGGLINTKTGVIAPFTQVLLNPTSAVLEGDDYTIRWDDVAAGNYDIEFKAYANGAARVTRSLAMHIYEMRVEIDGQAVNPTPTEGTFVADVNETLHINVTDGNNRAYTTAQVTGGSANGIRLSTGNRGRLNGDSVRVRQPGVYTVTYTDHMDNGGWSGNGTAVGTYTATIIAVRPESQTVIVEKGTGKKTITTKSDWDTTEVSGTGVAIENGEVVFDTNAVEAGEYNVTLSHNFSAEGVDVTKVTDNVRVIVYEVADDAGADTVRDLIESAIAASSANNWPMSMLDYYAKAQEVLGDNWFQDSMALSSAVFAGQNASAIETEVEVEVLDEELDADYIGEEMLAAVEALGMDGVTYYDVNVVMYSGNNRLGYLHELKSKIVVALLPAVEGPEDGYTRHFMIIKNHNGVITTLVEGEDFYVEDGVIYIISDEFSVYAVAYTDTLDEDEWTTIVSDSPNTGVFAGEGGSANASALVSVIATLVVLGLAGAVKLAKRK